MTHRDRDDQSGPTENRTRIISANTIRTGTVKVDKPLRTRSRLCVVGLYGLPSELHSTTHAILVTSLDTYTGSTNLSALTNTTTVQLLLRRNFWFDKTGRQNHHPIYRPAASVAGRFCVARSAGHAAWRADADVFRSAKYRKKPLFCI